VQVGLLRLRIEARISVARRRVQISLSARFRPLLPSFDGVRPYDSAECVGAADPPKMNGRESRPIGST